MQINISKPGDTVNPNGKVSFTLHMAEDGTGLSSFNTFFQVNFVNNLFLKNGFLSGKVGKQKW